MKTLFLLITLTQNGAGDVNASFVNTPTLQQCEQKSFMVEGVFKGSNIPVVESRYIRSDLQFSEFGHASTASKIRHFYLIKFDANSFYISSMPDWHTCMSQQLAETEHDSAYCSSSIQSLIQ